MAYRDAQHDEGEDETDLHDREAPDESDMDDDDASDTAPCPECGRAVYEGADVCPHCGSFIVADGGASRRPWWVLAAAILLLIVLLFGWVF
jgi:uncharacterized paraquat-inducible protein A